jgi:DNA-directed RNA polymerase subunit RPC12/RpoP
MSQTSHPWQWSGMVSGWLVAFMWPLAAGVMALLIRSLDANFDLDDLVVRGFFTLVIIAVLFKPALLLARFALLGSGRRVCVYPCPACGHDIHQTPHRCPHCKTRLVWGELPPDRHAIKRWTPEHSLGL